MRRAAAQGKRLDEITVKMKTGGRPALYDRVNYTDYSQPHANNRYGIAVPQPPEKRKA